MEHLNWRDRELVVLGAALGSNCISCIEHHIPEARKAGLSDPEIAEAVRVADTIRQVPAAKVLETAQALILDAPAPEPESASTATQTGTPCCGA